MVMIKSLIAAIALPLATALPFLSTRASDVNSSRPFTLHTEVVNGDASFGGFYLTSFHVGAAMQTIVGTKNSSIAIGWTINNSNLQQPISAGSASNLPPYNLTLLNQAPYKSNAPAGYDYISLSYSGSTPGFYFSNDTSNTVQHAGNSTFNGFALCHVNGTSPYFTLGPQYQLLWKASNATSSSELCADVNLVAANI